MENWLHKQAYLKPHHPALVTADQSLTFAELEKVVLVRARQLAGLLDDNPRVAILTPNTIAGYVIILALQQLGRKLVLLNRRLSAIELTDQLQTAEISQLIQDDEIELVLPVVEQLTFQEILATPEKEYVPVQSFNLDVVTTIMYTSGTTGRPKGVEQTFGNHFYSAIGSVLNLGLAADDCWLAAVPIFHISGFSIMMRSLIYGMTVRLYDHFDAALINRDLLAGRGSVISVVPAMLKAMLADLPDGVSYPATFHHLLLGGGPIDLPTLQDAQARGITVTQSYGMTETASQVVALNSESAQRKLGSVGKPLFPVRVRIDQPDHDGWGSVLIQSPTLTVGYLNAPEKYQASFTIGWFRSGDIGRFDGDGYLYIRGREGDMISSGGENVFPNEIESAYQQFPAIDEIVVAGVPNAKWGTVPVAFVKLRPGQCFSKGKLRAFGRKLLAHYKVPHDFVEYQAAWPRTASGKIQRYRLSEWYQSLQP